MGKMKGIKVKPGVPHKLDDGDNPTFEEWMARIDGFIWKYAGCSVDDLPDCQYRLWYDGRVRPIRAANRALKSAGAFCE
jgi:hypothetical protein